ncbi:MAG: hypothetical protein AVDCRST_MAG23-1285 [uncultured Sphingosinicella sp.]|uniref:Uncharacterized protein n=1 Tax=uncultured Sphingosinicella sp. TaxID=478748 RepID=A0A6J4TWE4_9SPHN|nr:MAG: hypothetical protein AVDCRST_MAG23-1285 [uncultured Sphingosinicella sp.]
MPEKGLPATFCTPGRTTAAVPMPPETRKFWLRLTPPIEFRSLVS